jgi:hypothetical protein
LDIYHNIPLEVAVAIMSSIVAVPRIGNPSLTMVTSIYSYSKETIFSVMDIVGYNTRTPKTGIGENHGIGKGYFYHYHPAHSYDTHSPHAFYGLPA